MAAAVDSHGSALLANRNAFDITASTLDSKAMPRDTEGTMREDELRAGARHIVEARRAIARLAGLPDACRPTSIADAYAMQRIATELWSDELVGWKVGATSKEVQALFGMEEPAYAPVFKQTVRASPARLKAHAFQHLLLEAEFAFSFRQSLPARPKPYAREEILAAVDTLIPAIEIISPRFRRVPADQAPQMVADFFGNGGAILGKPCRDWRGVDLASHAVSISIAGARRQEGTGAVVLDNPLNVVDWFVNALGSHGRTVEAGQFVLTGTMTGLHAPRPGETAVADFGLLGKVEVIFE
jgi:2-keto-4-pentenoate hydratase